MIYAYGSALSAYHEKVDNQPVCKHPKVCNLMTGVFNRNPPKPRYVFIWDIEQVLTFIRGMPNNSELSDRSMNLKLAILLFLTSAGRCHEICYLNINSWLEHKVLSSFSLPKLQKVGGKGNLHHVWSFMNILMMKNCV